MSRMKQITFYQETQKVVLEMKNATRIYIRIRKCLILLIRHHLFPFLLAIQQIHPEFVKVIEEGTKVEDMKDPYGYFFYAGEL